MQYHHANHVLKRAGFLLVVVAVTASAQPATRRATNIAALLAYPGLERRACVELLPAVVRGVRHFAGNEGVTGDPRVEIRVADGRHDLLLRPERYDLITLEPPPPIAAGVVNLYSRDFYVLCRDRLAPHGLMAQWLPISTQNDEDSRTLVRAFLDVFPHAALWSTEMHEMLLVGSAEPLVLDAGTITTRFAVPAVTAALAEVGVPDVASVLATYVTDRDGLVAYAGDAPPVTDDRPIQEYGAKSRLSLGYRPLPPSIFDLSQVAAWCPRCFVGSKPVPLADGLDVYLASLAKVYAKMLRSEPERTP